MQYLDLTGVAALWNKVKALAAASKTTVSINTSAAGAFDGFGLTTTVHNGQNEDGHTEYTFSLTGVASTTDLASKANASDLTTISGYVTTLVGSDGNKSVRTIANEELAAQLIPAQAQEALDTLQEIAQWIQDHPADAAAFNTAIQALQAKTALPQGYGTSSSTIVNYVDDAVDAEETRATGAELDLQKQIDHVHNDQDPSDTYPDGLKQRVAELEDAIGSFSGDTPIAEIIAEIQTVIEGLNYTVTSVASQDNVVTVSDTANVLTGFEIENGTLKAGSVTAMALTPITSAQINSTCV